MPSDPLVLAFDTSAAHCAAVILSDENVLAQRHEDMARGQAERLAPLVQEVLAEAGVTPEELGAIGVGVGPGNFTGVRISVSLARGMALALGIPAVGVSTLEALAIGYSGSVLCTVDARRDMVYAQVFNTGEASEPHLAEIKSLTLLPEAVGAATIGFRADELAERTGGNAISPAFPLAEAIARIARSRMHNVDLPRPAPLYLRAPDAAPPSDPPPEILS